MKNKMAKILKTHLIRIGFWLSLFSLRLSFWFATFSGFGNCLWKMRAKYLGNQDSSTFSENGKNKQQLLNTCLKEPGNNLLHAPLTSINILASLNPRLNSEFSASTRPAFNCQAKKFLRKTSKLSLQGHFYRSSRSLLSMMPIIYLPKLNLYLANHFRQLISYFFSFWGTIHTVFEL